MREHSGHYPHPLSACGAVVWAAAELQEPRRVEPPFCLASALTDSRNAFPSSCSFRPARGCSSVTVSLVPVGPLNPKDVSVNRIFITSSLKKKPLVCASNFPLGPSLVYPVYLEKNYCCVLPITAEKMRHFCLRIQASPAYHSQTEKYSPWNYRPGAYIQLTDVW